MSTASADPRLTSGLRQRLRKFFRFNLRSALLLVAILCGFLAWATRDLHLAYRRARLISAVEVLGGKASGNPDANPPGRFSAANSIASFWDERLTAPVEIILLPPHTTDNDAARIARLIVPLGEVRSVNFGGAAITDDGAAPFAACKQLRGIGLSGTKITDVVAPAIASLTNLESMSLAQTAISDRGVAELQTLPHLSTIDLSQTNVSDAALVRNQSWPRLMEIRLNGTRVTDVGVRAIQKRLPKLHVWVLQPQPRRETVADSAHDPLPSLAALATATQLLLDHPFFDDGSLARLSYCPHANSLQLTTSRVTHLGLRDVREKDRITKLEFADPSFDDRALAAIGLFTALEDLDLCETSITDEGLSHLAPLQNLRALRLNKTGITDAGIENLANLSKLRLLWLGWTCITDDGLRHLAHLNDLQELSLVCTGIDGSGLSHLANLNQLEWLLLDSTSLSDNGLSELPPLPSLNRIDFDSTEVSDTGLEHLKSFRKLSVVACRFTNITPAGIESFQSLVRQRTSPDDQSVQSGGR